MKISGAWIAVWRRNYLVWKKLATESVLGNIIEPLFYLVGFGMGIGAMVPEVDGVKYIAFLAGGTTEVDLVRQGVLRPGLLVDINDLPLTGVEDLPGGGLRIFHRSGLVNCHPA